MLLFLLIFIGFYAFYYYLSYQIILLNDLGEIFKQTANKAQADFKGHIELAIEDLSKCYKDLLIIIATIAILTFIWILLLKYNAKLIVWLSIFALPVLLSVGTYYSIKQYIHLHNGGEDQSLAESADDQQQLPFDRALQTILTAELLAYVRNETLWLVISVLLCLILTALVIALHSLRDRVRLSIAIIQQASKAINGVKTTLIFPILPRALGISVIGYGIMVSLLVISASHPNYRIEGGPNHGQPCHPRTFNKTTQSAVISAQRPALATGGGGGGGGGDPLRLSDSNIALASSESPTATRRGTTIRFNGTTTSSQQQQQQQQNDHNFIKPRCAAYRQVSRQHVWKYHAVNIFATLWLVHFISGINQTTLAGAFASYYWAFNKPRDVPYFAVTASFWRVIRHHLGDIAFGSFLIATIRYIRLVIEFIDNRIRKKNNPEINNATTRNAYIMMSMYGEDYLSSAKRAVKLLLNNTTRAMVLQQVTSYVLLISRLLLTALAGYVTAQMHPRWLPVVIVILASYFITKGLFSVYSMAVDTLFMCFLMEERARATCCAN